MDFEEIKNIASNCENLKELTDLCMGDLVVPYIGAGLSYFAGFPLWKSCLEKFINEYCNNKAISTENLYDAADAIMEDIKSDKFNEVFFDTFGGNLGKEDWNIILDKARKQAIFAIPNLFNGPIITTNFDQILEKIHGTDLSVAFPNHLEEINNAIKHRKRLIYKIHGCVSEPNNVVFTGKSYKKAYRSNSELVKKLSDFFKGVIFLFLGCGLDLSKKGKDKPIELWEKLTKTRMYHFAILECPDDMEKRKGELEKHNIKPIFFPKGKFDTIKIILNEILERKKTAFGKIPEYKSDFIGRKNILNEIEQHLEKLDYSTFDLVNSAFALTGTGGAGKTRIMHEYANKKKELQAYKSIVWFNAVSKDSVQAGIYQFAVKEKLIVEGITETPKEIFGKVKNWMMKNDDWLFLLDNVESYKDIEDLLSIKSDVVTKGKRHFLITTRKSELPIKYREVDVFTESESQYFLHSYTGLEPNEFSRKIAVELGHLPLALEQASAYIKKSKNISYQNYSIKLKKSLAILKEGYSEGRTLSVEATWNISMRMIDSEEAKQLLNFCAFFAPNNINCNWFREASEQLHLYSALQKKIENEDKFKKILYELAEYSLVRIENDKISIHRLTQEAIKNSLNGKKKLIDTSIKIMNEQIFTDFSTARLRNNFVEMTSHIITLTRCSFSKTKKIANLYFFLGCGFNELANYNEALKYYSIALRIRKKILCKEHHDIIVTYNNIGLVLENQSNYAKALEYYQKALTISENDLESIDAAYSYHGIANIYNDQGQYTKALEYYQKAITIRENKIGKEHPDTARSYNNIGIVYMNQKKYEKALKYYQKASNIFEDKLRRSHPLTANTYNNIGEVYYNQGYYIKALEYYQKDLDICEKVLGKEHPSTAYTYNNIGEVYHKQGNSTKALDYYKKAFNIRKKTLGKEHPDTATSYNNIGLVYLEQHNFDSALKCFQKALKIFENLFGKEHHDTKKAYNNLTLAYNASGNSKTTQK
jgi:tetratricopeptide (TPR) repeat protein